LSVLIENENTKIISIEVPEKSILKTVNFYLVKRNQSLFLIDAGYNSDHYWTYLHSNLHQQGYQLSDLTAILLTHFHVDHVGLVYRIAKQHNIPIYIHPYGGRVLKKDPAYLEMRYAFFTDIYRKLNCGTFGDEKVKSFYKKAVEDPESAIDWNLNDIEASTIFDFEVMEIFGHTQDQLGFYLADEGIIFLGDLLIDHLASNAFVDPALDGSRPLVLAQHRESLEKIIALEPVLALSGHGKPIHDPVALAKRRINRIEDKANSFLTMIENGISTGSEIVKQRHPKKYEALFSTVMRDAFGFLDYLEDEGKITKEEIDGVWHYSINNI